MDRPLSSNYANIIRSVRTGDLRDLKAQMKFLAPNERKRLLSSPCSNLLALACENGHLLIVKYLVDRCQADIEQSCYIQYQNEKTIEARPLWCASTANHYCIVKFLIKRGADPNSLTSTYSTPLRTACHNGNFKIVKYLVENGANIEVSNMSGHTCLMKACLNKHPHIVKYLLEQGALVNSVTNSGDTALHECAGTGCILIMRLLISYGAKMKKNCFGTTPLMVAAAFGHVRMVKKMIDLGLCGGLADYVDSLDLLGAYFLDVKCDVNEALSLWRSSIGLREEYNIPKNVDTNRNEVYNNLLEFSTVEQLEECAVNVEDLTMQALLVRERILRAESPYTCYFIKLRGVTYADSGNFDKCLSLWNYVLDIQQNCFAPLVEMTKTSFVALSNILSNISNFVSHPSAQFKDLFIIYQKISRELSKAVLEYDIINSISLSGSFIDVLKISCLTLILIHKILPCLPYSYVIQLESETSQLVRLASSSIQQQSMLHAAIAACPESILCDDRQSACFESVIEMLIKLGVSPDQADIYLNTPLHLLAFRQCCPRLASVMLRYGAHADYRNADGETPLDVLAKTGKYDFYSILVGKISLQCLAARVICKYGLNYKGFVPSHLEIFISRH